MIRKMLATLHLAAGTTIAVLYAGDEIRTRLKKIAETEKVGSAKEYVLVRLARGDYNNAKGLETMFYDYKFYPIAEQFHK